MDKIIHMTFWVWLKS